MIDGADSRIHGAIALHSPPASASQADAERGVEIAREMKARDRGFGDSTATLKVVLIDASGGLSRLNDGKEDDHECRRAAG